MVHPGCWTEPGLNLQVEDKADHFIKDKRMLVHFDAPDAVLACDRYDVQHQGPMTLS
jgi:hypothetical protein